MARAFKRSTPDPALDRIATIIEDLVQNQDKCSYMDFADMRTLFLGQAQTDFTKVWVAGIGEARRSESGGTSVVALAVKRALQDLSAQLRKTGHGDGA